MIFGFKNFGKPVAAVALAISLVFSTPALAQNRNDQTATELNITLYIGSSAVNVRTGAGTSNGIARVMKPGEKVVVYQRHGDWGRISARNEAERWVYTPLLKDGPPVTQASFQTSKASPSTVRQEPVAKQTQQQPKAQTSHQSGSQTAATVRDDKQIPAKSSGNKDADHDAGQDKKPTERRG